MLTGSHRLGQVPPLMQANEELVLSERYCGFEVLAYSLLCICILCEYILGFFFFFNFLVSSFCFA